MLRVGPAFFVCVLCAGVVHAQAQVGVLPSRAAGAPALRARVVRVGQALGLLQVGGWPSAPSFALEPTVQRAEALAAGGKLDEAAALLDVALDQGARAPLLVSDPPAFVRAAVARASIGLARGERERAEALLGQLHRYDPTFALLPREDAPRVRAAVERARQRLGPAPPLVRADLGERCAGATLLVARRIDAKTVEYTRFEDCRETGHTRAGDDAPEATVVAALGGPVEVAAPAPPPPAADAPRPSPTPVYRRAWFWGLTAGIVAAAGVGIWAATRTGGTSDTTWTVAPHF